MSAAPARRPGRPRTECPALCHDKCSDRAFARIDGHKTYFGKWGSTEAEAGYHKFVAEWMVKGRPRSDGSVASAAIHGPVTVLQLCVAFMIWGRKHYGDGGRPEGKRPDGELGMYFDVLRQLGRLYGATPASEFGSAPMMALQEHLIRLNWCRNQINRQISRVRRVFRWGVAHQVIDQKNNMVATLDMVDGLLRGKTRARESERVKPAGDDQVEAILDHLSPQVQAMVKLEAITGMRPGEICIMRERDIDATEKTWRYRPQTHKTAHRGHDRVIHLGPQARQIIEQFLQRSPEDYLFNPADAAADRRAARNADRLTPLNEGNRPGSNVVNNPKIAPGDRYTPKSYRRAVVRARRHSPRRRHWQGAMVRRFENGRPD